MVTLSCGHQVNSFHDRFDVILKTTNREGGKAVAYMVVCEDCKTGYEQDDQLFRNEEQAFEWLRA